MCDDENDTSKSGSTSGSWLYIWISEMATKEDYTDQENSFTDSLPVIKITKDNNLSSQIGNKRNEKQTLETIIEDITERFNEIQKPPSP